MSNNKDCVSLFELIVQEQDWERRLQLATQFREQWEGVISQKIVFNRSELPKFQKAILTKSEEWEWESQMQEELHDIQVERCTQARQVIIDAGLAHLLPE